MDLRQLRYLVAVHDEGGVRAASRVLHVSQPQISRLLVQLEGEIGVQLLHRARTGMVLTEAGEELVARSRDILGRVSDAGAAMRRLSDSRAGTLRVGLACGVLSAGELLGPMIESYRTAYPDAAVHLHDLGMRDQLTPLLEDQVDVAIVRPPLDHPEIRVTPIAREPRVLAVGTLHELADEEELSLDDVLGFPTLTLGCRPEWCHFWELNDERGGALHGDGAPVTTTGETGAALASQPLLTATSASSGRLAAHPLIRTIRLRDATPTVIAVAHKRHGASRRVRRFVEHAQACAERDIGLLLDGALP